MKKSEAVVWVVEHSYVDGVGIFWRPIGPEVDCHRTRRQAIISLRKWRAMVSEQRLKREYRVSKYVRVEAIKEKGKK